MTDYHIFNDFKNVVVSSLDNEKNISYNKNFTHKAISGIISSNLIVDTEED